MNRHRVLWLAVVVPVASQCVYWVVASLFAWAFRGFMVDPGSPVAARRTLLAIVVLAATSVNVTALALFLLKPVGWRWILLAAVQIGDLLLSLAWVFAIGPDWWLPTALSAIALLALYMSRAGRISKTFAGPEP
jgi:hypothetical protein